MTSIRKLALQISYTVVHFSYPGCKEWAEGLRAETAAIDGDWAALRWALGSTRVLLDRRKAPLRSVCDAQAAAHKLIETQRGSIAFGWISALNALLYLASLIGAKDWQHIVGDSLISLVWALYAFGSLIVRRRLKAVSADDPRTELLYYKADLERKQNPLRTCEGWVTLLAFFFYSIGATLTQALGTHTGMITAALFVFILFLLLRTALSGNEKNRRALAELESVLANIPSQ